VPFFVVSTFNLIISAAATTTTATVLTLALSLTLAFAIGFASAVLIICSECGLVASLVIERVLS